MAEVLEQEREAELAAMDVSSPSNLAATSQFLISHSPQPRNPLSPNAISPGGGGDLEENPFDTEFNDYDEDDLDEDEGEKKPIRTTFELNDTLYAEAELEDTDTVYLWLGVRFDLLHTHSFCS